MKVDKRKIVQIVNYILKKYSYKLNYTKLIKLLYIIDKEALRRWDTTVTKDQYCSMDSGPVLSGTYDLIKDKNCDCEVQSFWNTFFLTDKYDLISLNGDKLPDDELSEREISLIDEIDKKFHDWDFGRLIDYLHDKRNCPEWDDPQGSSIPLDIKRILKSVGRSDKEIDAILLEDAEYEENDAILLKCCG